MIDLAKLERKILDEYCTDESGVRPTARIADESADRMVIEITFTRYARNKYPMNVPNTIWLTINTEVDDDVEDISAEYEDFDSEKSVEDRHIKRVSEIYQRMVDDIDNDNFTI